MPRHATSQTPATELPSAAHAPHHDHDGGLAADLPRLVDALYSRRRTLGLLAGAGSAVLFGCGGGGSSSAASSTSTDTTTGTTTVATTDTTSSTTTTSTTTTTATDTTSTTTTTATDDVASCTAVPEETPGPFPADGSNSSNGSVANALALTGIVRSDIRSSLAGATGVAGGVPLTLKLRVVNSNGACADLSGYAVYLWHCDREGRYSMYTAGVTAENYLRGVQVTDSDGLVTFTTVYPGCYSGRVPHMHFEIYRSATTATSFSNKLKTSQLALPTAVSTAVYATTGYSASVANLARVTFASDPIFSDGVTTQLATVTGNVTDGYVATLTVGISA